MSTKHSLSDVSNALRVKRACLLCERKAKALQKSGVRVLTITPQLYTHDGEQRVVKMCRGVSICEDCFVKAACGADGNPYERELSRSIQLSVRSRYNAIVSESVSEAQ